MGREVAAWRLAASGVVMALALSACTEGSDPGTEPAKTARPPQPVAAGASECGRVRIATDASAGFEISTYVVGLLAESQLGCDVTYLDLLPREAWHAVADGRADVYLDAYGSQDLRRRYTRPGGPAYVVGPTGMWGTVALMAPAWMVERGLTSSLQLKWVEDIGWDKVPPTLTTTDDLRRLAGSLLAEQGAEEQYRIRTYDPPAGQSRSLDMLQEIEAADEEKRPGVYMLATPTAFLAGEPSVERVNVPPSLGEECTYSDRTATCSLRPFAFQKVVSRDFAESGSPAYGLIYRYALEPSEAGELLNLVRLSGYDVRTADAASWINTHADVWREWMPAGEGVPGPPDSPGSRSTPRGSPRGSAAGPNPGDPTGPAGHSADPSPGSAGHDARPTRWRDPRWRFFTQRRGRYTSRWFAGEQRVMIDYGCTDAPYYSPDPRCSGGRGFHHGIDVAMRCGTPVRSAVEGRVVDPDATGALGTAYGPQAMRIRDHGSGVDIVLGHMSRVFVQPGDRVTRGQRVALASDRAAPDGCHLHFEVRDAGGGLDDTRSPGRYLRLTRVHGD